MRWNGKPATYHFTSVQTSTYMPDSTEHRAITRNRQMYPRADEFDPGRWVDPLSPTYIEPLDQFPNLSGFSQFGFGKRTCQGVPIVEQDLFVTMGGIAWGFDVRKQRHPVTDESRIVHWDNYTPLLIAKPMPFPFDALPRTRHKLVLMRNMFEGVTVGPLPFELRPGMAISNFKPDPGWKCERTAGSWGTDTPDENMVDWGPEPGPSVGIMDLDPLLTEELPPNLDFPSHLGR